MKAPGTVLAPLSSLMIRKSGAAVSGVVSRPVLSAAFKSAPFAPSSPIVTVLVMVVTPAGTELAIVNTKGVELLLPAAKPPMLLVQRLLALLSGLQLQPAPLKVVLAGTVSVRTTPVAPCVPVLVYVTV